MTAAPTGGAIRILTVDDHPMLREGIAAVVQSQSDMRIVGEASNGVEAVERFDELRPDVTLMDLQMPELNGIDALKVIRQRHPDARVIMLTTYAGDMHALKAVKTGAVGYLLKSALRRELVDAIRHVHAGGRHIAAEIANELAMHVAQDALTEREVRVLTVVATGKPSKVIARELRMSEETVKSYLKTIFAKLGAATRTEAVAIAMRRGIIDT